MATFVYALNQSIDGNVDHTAFSPGPELFAHFVEQTRASVGCVYGRGMYELMRYWETDDPGWSEAERAYAHAWREQPTWVVSNTLTEVGPGATLLSGDAATVAATLRDLTAHLTGEVEVAGPRLAQSLSDVGLIDEYRVYLHPVVVGEGPRLLLSAPPLRLVAAETLPEGVVSLVYRPVAPGAPGADAASA